MTRESIWDASFLPVLRSLPDWSVGNRREAIRLRVNTAGPPRKMEITQLTSILPLPSLICCLSIQWETWQRCSMWHCWCGLHPRIPKVTFSPPSPPPPHTHTPHPSPPPPPTLTQHCPFTNWYCSCCFGCCFCRCCAAHLSVIIIFIITTTTTTTTTIIIIITWWFSGAAKWPDVCIGSEGAGDMWVKTTHRLRSWSTCTYGATYTE